MWQAEKQIGNRSFLVGLTIVCSASAAGW